MMTTEGNTCRCSTELDTWHPPGSQHSQSSQRWERSSSCHQAQLPSHLTTASHCSAQPESPYSVSPVTFTFIYRSVRFLPHVPCQPPKTPSPCFLHSVWCLSTVLHLQGQSTALNLSSTSIQFPMMTPPCNPLFTSVSPMGTGGTSCCPRNSCQQPQQYLPQSCIFTLSLPLDNSKPTITVSLSYNSFQSSPIVFPSHSTHLKDHSQREYFSASKNIFCSLR